MKKLLIALFLIISFFINAQSYQWAYKFGSSNDDDPFGVVTDKFGNTYISGNFWNSVDFDPGPGTNILTSAGNTDIFFAKYDSNGNYIWAKSIGGGGADASSAITIDSAGNIYIAGGTSSSIDYDPNAGTAYLSGGTSSNMFFAKYDNNGNFIWANGIGTVIFSNSVYKIATDLLGNVYLSGSFMGQNVDFDPSSNTAYLSSAGGNNYHDIFLAKYDVNGNYLWANRIGGTSDDASNCIITDANGNSYIAGIYWGSVDFDPGAAVANLNSGGMFYAKYDSNGNYVWAKSIINSGGGNYNANSLAYDPNGNLIFLGGFNSYNSNVDFDPSSGIANLNSNMHYETFILKYDINGNYLSVKGFPFVGSNNGNGSASVFKVDNFNNYYLAGSFNGTTVDFDPGAGTAYLTANGNSNIFFAKYDSSAKYIWAKNMGNNNSNNPNAIISIQADQIGNTYIIGHFQGTIDFNPGPGIANMTANAISWDDIFFAKYSPCQTLNTSNSYTICSGSSYVINGHTYTVSGTYHDTLQSNTGCDSIINTKLTVNPKPIINISNGIICKGNSYTLNPIGANTYTYSSGNSVVNPNVNTTYTITGIDTNGCSNTVTANVIVKPNYKINNYQSICSGSSYNLNGHTYSLDGTYNDTLYTMLGCDSIIITQLKVNPLPNVNIDSHTICAGQSFTLNPSGANTYTYSSGNIIVTPSVTTIYTITGTDTNGCIGSDTAFVYVNTLPPPPVLSTGNNPINLCQGAVIPTLIVDKSSDITVWRDYQNNVVSFDSSYTLPNNLPIGTVNYTIIDSMIKGCISSPLTITVSTYPTPSATITAQGVCFKDTTVFGINYYPSGINPTFKWDFGDGSTTSVQNPSYTYLNCGNYSVSCLVISNNNCVDTVYNTANVYCLPNSNVNVTQTSCGLCNGSATVTTSGGTPPYQLTWPMGNQQAVVIGLCAGTDSCFVTDVNGCKDTVIALINNSNISSLSTSFSISSDPAPHVWDAYPTIIGGSSPYTYLWTWGDGTSDTALYSSHTYTSAANYNICLNVTDASGCSNTYCLNDSLYRTSGIVQINVINGSISISQTSGNNSKVIVYPNPANASIHIVVGNDQFTEIKIIDVLGKGVLYSTQPNIEVKSLQNGVYFLEVKTIEGILTKKIIVQH